MAKICMISVNHSPLDDRIFFKEALSLKSAGHEISMICRADENRIMYDMGNSIPLSKIEDSFVEFEEIKAYPIPSPTGFANTLLKKIFRGSFYTNFIQQGIQLNADVYHAHEPESYYIGLKISQKTGAKLIFDSHESYSTGTLKERWIKHMYLKDMRFLIAANHITRGHLVSINPLIQSCVIYNAAEPNLYLNNQITTSDIITITHDGYLPFNRGLKEMLDAFKNVYAIHKNTRFKIIGETKGEEKEYLNQFIRRHNFATLITETGWVNYQDVSTHLRGCQIGIIAKTNTVNNVIGGPPIKYYNYTASGIAVIDVNMPETSRLLGKYKNGISIPDRSVESLTKGILELVESPNLLLKYQENSKKAFGKLNWNNEGTKLVEFYKNVVLHKEATVKH
ncbi:MAG: glycosyltransferase involved in cell wall biosynthesis [Salibacteraceae bacterium]|jgi:glycosyltransferase involved in cell wall biosynthesis